MMNNDIRLQKLISNYGSHSRREVEAFIIEGKVFKNGEKVTLGDKGNINDKIEIDGKIITFITKHDYFLVNKPKGYISKRVDHQHKEVISLVPNVKQRNIFTIGRLDVTTSGLIIVTSDGELSEKINKPSSRIKKTYLVWSKELSRSAIFNLKKGVVLDDGYRTRPISNFKPIKLTDNVCTYKISITEGKKNQIKRMWIAVDSEVINLKRIGIGNISVDKIPIGGYKKMMKQELYEGLGVKFNA